MQTFLLNSGVGLLTAQSNEDIASIIITGFKVGTTIGDAVAHSNTEPEGDIVFESDESNIYYVPVSQDEVLLIFRIEKEETFLPMGNIVIYGNSDTAFVAAIANHAIFKFEKTEHQVGTTMSFSMILHIPNLMDRFDFSNLTLRTTDLRAFDTEDEVTRWPWEEASDQLFVEEDSRTGRPTYVAQAARQFWATSKVKDFDSDTDMIGIHVDP